LIDTSANIVQNSFSSRWHSGYWVPERATVNTGSQ